MLNRLFSIAPMLDCTDRHCRYLFRLISRHVLLYTEMISTGAILYGDRDRHLQFHPDEHPVALQLGGSDPTALHACSKIGVEYGYDEINLNIGCPSDRVQAARFGACLMKEPELVADCITAMREGAGNTPVTVKTRLGVDNQDSYTELSHFIASIAHAGCDVFIMHARKAWLKGLSPKENRTVPPLRYDWVLCLQADFPHLQFILNGGLQTYAQWQIWQPQFSGLMIGRAAYHHPYLLATLDRDFYGCKQPISTREMIAEKYQAYMHTQVQQGARPYPMKRHLLGLYHAQPGVKQWRRSLMEKIPLRRTKIHGPTP